MVDSLELSMADGTPWRYAVNFGVSGEIAASGDADLDSVEDGNLPIFLCGKTFVTINATPQTTAPTVDAPVAGLLASSPNGWSAGTNSDYGSWVRGVRYGINNGLQRSYTGGTGGYVTKMYRSPRVQTLSVDFDYDTDVAFIQLLPTIGNISAGNDKDYSIIVYSLQGTKVGAQNYYHAFALYFPKVSLLASSAPAGNPRRITANFQINEPGISTAIAGKTVYAYSWNADNVTYAG
jgi:hypothetical protein